MREIEIISPAGSYESLMAAIQGGADAVYFGVENLNMRAASAYNFTIDELPKIADICRENNIKSYATINTIIYDDEIAQVHKIIDKVKECRIDAVLATDIAVMSYAREKNVAVHLSTQCNVTNFETVKFYSWFADVITLARELTLEQVSDIVKKIKREQIKGPSGKLVGIEIFIHGALCMAISGRCYMSLHTQNHSANRGNCLQPCRRTYIVTDKENGTQMEIENEYIMSPKDLCTIGFIDKVLNTGVTILKIEGRGRSADYVKVVTEVYREAVESYFEGNYTKEKIKKWEEKLKTVYNRGFWDGYYLGRKEGEWSERYGSSATKRKIYVGKVVNYFSKIKVAEFKVEAESISVGDEVKIVGPTTGVVETTVKEIRVDLSDRSRQTSYKGEHFSMPVETKVRESDKLYKVVDA